jgi:hypothetical protein
LTHAEFAALERLRAEHARKVRDGEIHVTLAGAFGRRTEAADAGRDERRDAGPQAEATPSAPPGPTR